MSICSRLHEVALLSTRAHALSLLIHRSLSTDIDYNNFAEYPAFEPRKIVVNTVISDLHQQLNGERTEARPGISQLVDAQLDQVSGGGDFWLKNPDGSDTFVRSDTPTNN